jgi:hypothetical protein
VQLGAAPPSVNELQAESSQDEEPSIETKLDMLERLCMNVSKLVESQYLTRAEAKNLHALKASVSVVFAKVKAEFKDQRARIVALEAKCNKTDLRFIELSRSMAALQGRTPPAAAASPIVRARSVSAASGFGALEDAIDDFGVTTAGGVSFAPAPATSRSNFFADSAADDKVSNFTSATTTSNTLEKYDTSKLSKEIMFDYMGAAW